uniref:Venom odorant binding family protein 1 n=1 Tax=Pristhesancus plagipennis TaxID=1955184 RepID=A0A1Q1NPA5_PRIPG|nr:venom odorant binding family protein 1 [Pristhesancus plagipennis]
MNTLLLFTFVCVFVAAIQGASVPRLWPAKEEQALENCSAEKNIPLELARKILSHQLPAENEDDKCLMSCYMKATNVLVNHKVNWESIYESHIAHIKDPETRERIKAIFKKCEENFTYEGKDDCQIAYDAYTCK